MARITGTSTVPTLEVPDINGLKGVICTPLHNGDECFVDNVPALGGSGTYKLLRSSTAAVDNVNVVMPSDGQGRWVLSIGIPGPAGTSAVSTTTQNFTQPAVSSTVVVQVGSSLGFALGQTIFVSGGGYYTVTDLPTTTSVTLSNNGATGNAATGTVIVAGAGVTPGGAQGPAGPGTVGMLSIDTVTAGSDFTSPNTLFTTVNRVRRFEMDFTTTAAVGAVITNIAQSGPAIGTFDSASGSVYIVRSSVYDIVMGQPQSLSDHVAFPEYFFPYTSCLSPGTLWVSGFNNAGVSQLLIQITLTTTGGYSNITKIFELPADFNTGGNGIQKILYDGTSIWLTGSSYGTLAKFDVSAGTFTDFPITPYLGTYGFFDLYSVGPNDLIAAGVGSISHFDKATGVQTIATVPGGSSGNLTKLEPVPGTTKVLALDSQNSILYCYDTSTFTFDSLNFSLRLAGPPFSDAQSIAYSPAPTSLLLVAYGDGSLVALNNPTTTPAIIWSRPALPDISGQGFSLISVVTCVWDSFFNDGWWVVEGNPWDRIEHIGPDGGFAGVAQIIVPVGGCFAIEGPSPFIRYLNQPSNQIPVTSSTYAISTQDNAITVDTTANAVSMTLPYATSGVALGTTYLVIDAGGHANTHNITVAPPPGSTINGASVPITINTAYGIKNFIKVGSKSWVAY